MSFEGLEDRSRPELPEDEGMVGSKRRSVSLKCFGGLLTDRFELLDVRGWQCSDGGEISPDIAGAWRLDGSAPSFVRRACRARPWNIIPLRD